jgi:hypothetical protein
MRGRYGTKILGFELNQEPDERPPLFLSVERSLVP